MYDVVEVLLSGDSDGRAALIRDDAARPALEAYLGPTAYAEYRAFAAPEHLASQPPNLLFVPGVMGKVSTVAPDQTRVVTIAGDQTIAVGSAIANSLYVSLQPA